MSTSVGMKGQPGTGRRVLDEMIGVDSLIFTEVIRREVGSAGGPNRGQACDFPRHNQNSAQIRVDFNLPL